MDDENVSQQVSVTRGGGALTLASQWKSQFDDSEETTDNEWKPESPEHRAGMTLATSEGGNAMPPALSRISEDSRGPSQRKHVNIAGIEDYPDLVGGLPRAWSTPSLGPTLRRGLKPPLLQQAAFDELVFRVDVMRNVASRHPAVEDGVNKGGGGGGGGVVEVVQGVVERRWGSLPTVVLNDVERFKEDEEEDGEGDEQKLQEVAGKLEIRVVHKPPSEQQQQQAPSCIATCTTTTHTNLPSRPTTLPEQQPPESNEQQLQQVQSAEQKDHASPKVNKLERTKSILKQSSKERAEAAAAAEQAAQMVQQLQQLQMPQSPSKRDQITFAPELELERHNAEKQRKRISIEGEVVVVGVVDKAKEEEEEQEEDESDKIKPGMDRRKSKSNSPPSKSPSNSHINFEAVEALSRSASFKAAQAAAQAHKTNKAKSPPPPNKTAQNKTTGAGGLSSGESTTSSSNSSAPADDTNHHHQHNQLLQLRTTKNGGNNGLSEGGGSSSYRQHHHHHHHRLSSPSAVKVTVHDVHGVGVVGRCSSGVDLTSHPAVTFVQQGGGGGGGGGNEHGKSKRSAVNGLSPGVEEQSEYFDATENPLFRDKKQDQDDEDSGVDNASQILRETSISPGGDGSTPTNRAAASRIPIAVLGVGGLGAPNANNNTSSSAGQRLAKCMSWSGGDLTPGLRRRRQAEKYVTDVSQLNLRFKRHSTAGNSAANTTTTNTTTTTTTTTTGGGTGETESSPDSSDGERQQLHHHHHHHQRIDRSNPTPPPPPEKAPPPTSESNVRCRRFRPVT